MLELFANPAYLVAGGALISSPIIIHLINRMRFKRMRWAAMEFLLKAQKRSRRRLIIEQLILLLLRCLLVALAALLVARFLGFSLDSLGSAFGQQRENVHIVLLDDTLSMRDQWREGGGAEEKSCFALARKEVIIDGILSKVSQSMTNDKVIIVPLSKVALDPKFQPRIYDHLNTPGPLEAAKNEVMAMQPSFVSVDAAPAVNKAFELGTGNLKRGFDKAIEALPDGSKAILERRVTVHVVSDFRKHDWVGLEARPLQEGVLKLAKSGMKVRLVDTAHPLRVKGQNEAPVYHDNIGISEIRASTRITGKGMPVQFTVTVANFTPRETDVHITLLNHSKSKKQDAEGHEMLDVSFNERMPLKVPAASSTAPGTATATFEHKFFPELEDNEAYFAHISARLESPQRGPLENDGLLDDNVRHVAVEIRNKVPILVVDGKGAEGRKKGGDSFFVEHALNSVLGSSYEVIHADKLERAAGDALKALEAPDLAQYPTILLLNVPSLTPEQTANLEKFVREGGGVGFFLGPDVDPLHYNDNLYKRGIFPMPLEEKFFPPKGRADLPTDFDEKRAKLLLRDDLFTAKNEQIPVFGAILKEEKLRGFLKHLPVRRYWPVREVAGLPQELAAEATNIANGLPPAFLAVERADLGVYHLNLMRYKQLITEAAREADAGKLVVILRELLTDRGNKKDLADLSQFWKLGDRRITELAATIQALAERLQALQQVREVANLPNDKTWAWERNQEKWVSAWNTIAGTEYAAKAEAIANALPLDREEAPFPKYRANLKLYHKALTNAARSREATTTQLADILKDLLADRGNREELANLTELWKSSDPKLTTLVRDIQALRQQLLYSHPLMVIGQVGQGRVLAVMTSAGQAWSDWAGGISGSVLYPAIIWEMQNYLSSSSGESSRPVGTPIRLTVDPKRFEGKALKASRYYYKAEPGKPIQVTPLEIGQFRDAPEQPRIILGEDNKPLPPDKQPVPAADNGAVTFTFRNTGEPGLYVTYLRFADQNEDGPPLATYGQIFNVDTKKEGKLQRASQEDLTSGFLREAPLDNPIEAPVDPIEPTTANEIPISARNDVSEWPWFFLLFLGILVGEQALAVHLSFHLKGTEAELPSQVVQPHGKAA